MDLNNVVNLQITVVSSALKSVGFGTPLLLPTTVPGGFTERLRYYSDPADMVTDGFATTDWAYVEAVAIASQSPHVDRWAVGRRLAAVAQSQVFTLPANPDDSVTYAVTINGQTIPTAALDGTSTTAELLTALIAAINGNADIAAVVTAAASGADLIVTSDIAGVPFTYAVAGSNVALITLGAAVANVGIADDLTAITLYQPDWYCLLLEKRDRNILVAAAAIEAQRRFFVAQCNDAEILSNPYDAADTDTDLFSELKALGYHRTLPIYCADDAVAMDGAVVGRCLAPIPGSINWKFKQLAGVSAATLNTTELTNLLSKNGNALVTCSSVSIFIEGTAASGRFIDVTHGVDKLYVRMQTLVFSALLAAPKVPFTQPGLDALASPMRAALAESASDGVVATSRTLADGTIQAPAFTVTPPLITAIPASDREARRIPSSTPYRFEATLAGAINSLRIVGTVSF